MTYKIYTIKDESVTKNNIYLIKDIETNNTAVIDPACSIDKIEEAVIKHGLLIKYVFVTHTHEDHIRIVDKIIDAYNTEVYISKREAKYYTFSCKNLTAYEDGAVIMCGKTEIKCIVTPGHTYGSSCFLLSDSLFCGDTIFIEGCGMCSTKGSSADELYESLKKIKENVDDNVRVYPGHNYSELPGKTLKYLKNNNIYFMIEKKEEFIDFRMRKNQKGCFDFI